MLLVFEGADHTGKTTQCRLFSEWLQKNRDAKVKQIRFPHRTNHTGKAIDAYLKDKTIEKPQQVTHLMFSANRWECQPQMSADLAAGTTLVCDRYTLSGAAYSMASGMSATDPCLAVDTNLPRPTLTFYLEHPKLEEVVTRGDFGAERFETASFQEKVLTAYKHLLSEAHNCITVDASGTIDEVHTRIIAAFEEWEPSRKQEEKKRKRPREDETEWSPILLETKDLDGFRLDDIYIGKSTKHGIIKSKIHSNSTITWMNELIDLSFCIQPGDPLLRVHGQQMLALVRTDSSNEMVLFHIPTGRVLKTHNIGAQHKVVAWCAASHLQLYVLLHSNDAKKQTLLECKLKLGPDGYAIIIVHIRIKYDPNISKIFAIHEQVWALSKNESGQPLIYKFGTDQRYVLPKVAGGYEDMIEADIFATDEQVVLTNLGFLGVIYASTSDVLSLHSDFADIWKTAYLTARTDIEQNRPVGARFCRESGLYLLWSKEQLQVFKF